MKRRTLKPNCKPAVWRNRSVWNGIPAQLRCTNAARFAVVRAYPDVEGSRIAEGLDDGAFGCGLADVWLTLPEVSQRVGPRPVGFVQPASQVDLAARRRDTERLRSSRRR